MTGCEAYPVGLGSDLSDSEDLECHENKWEASEIVSGLYVGSIASARDSCALFCFARCMYRSLLPSNQRAPRVA